MQPGGSQGDGAAKGTYLVAGSRAVGQPGGRTLRYLVADW